MFDAKAFQEWLDSEEGQKSIQNYCDKISAERKAQEDFFETPVFNKYVEEIREMLAINKMGDSESLLYHPWRYLLPYRSFMNVFNAIFATHTPVDGSNTGFPTETVDYKGIRFVVTHGQGSCCTAELIK